MQRKLFFFTLMVLTGAILLSCKSSTAPNPNVIFKATLTGASEAPPNQSTATGSATLTFNNSTKIFTVAVTYTGLTAASGHIHKAAVGVAGGVVFPFTSPLSSPVNYTSAALTTDQETDLNAGLYYVNLHSTAFAGGEIRGQLLKQ